jgi:tRNA(Ile)-lysidine synthase
VGGPPAVVRAEVLARVPFATCGAVPPVVVGCSGGADSTALLALAAAAGLDPTAVHVDHGIREDSAAEAGQAAALAERVGAHFVSVTLDVGAGPNLEARARDARLAALDTVRAELHASVVLLGHTADDQAETVVLNLLRGAAASGLAGMAARRDAFARPLLGWRRSETRALCAELGLPVFDDPMNEDLAFRRVAVRQEVLPLLDRVAGRDLVPVLARQAELLREESEFLDALAASRWPGPEGRAQADELCALPPVLARRALRCWLGVPPPSAAEVARVLAVADGTARAAELAGGRVVRRTRGALVLTR